jgi:hypothetical protein
MTGLREMFDEVAEAPAPPSRLVADEVYTTGRRRRTRNGILKGLAAAVALLAAVGVGGAIATPEGGESPAPGGSAVPEPDVSGPAQWVAAADSAHLYITYLNCPDGTCPKTTVRLLGSDDGGRTWQQRGAPIDVVNPIVVDERTLVAPVSQSLIKVSVDGGRTWSAATRASQDMAAVPEGGTLFCQALSDATDTCRLIAVDPKSRTFASLATQPRSALSVGPVESAAGHLWVAGTTTAKSCLPAASVSTDGGRNWATHILPDPAGGGSQRCASVRITTTADGQVAYAVVRDAGGKSRSVYRVRVDGSPELVDTTNTYDNRDASFVTADGTHVLARTVRGERVDELRWLAAGPAGYEPIILDGLPGTVYPVRRTPDGWFYTHSYGSDRSVYGSIDGRHWSPVPTPGR